MARSAAARLLAFSPLLLGSNHCHLRLRHPPLLLLPTSRSKTTSRKPPRSQPRRKLAPAPAGSGRPEPPGARASLFQEISELVASVANVEALGPRRNGGAPCDDLGAAAVGCTDGARGIASERAALASTSIAGSISDRVVLGDSADDESRQSCGTITNAAEAFCQEAGNTGMAVDSDVDNISAMVHRITAVLRSEAPGPSVERKLERLGANYTPNLVNIGAEEVLQGQATRILVLPLGKATPRFPPHDGDVQHDAVHRGRSEELWYHGGARGRDGSGDVLQGHEDMDDFIIQLWEGEADRQDAVNL